jgi:hypothetical protein
MLESDSSTGEESSTIKWWSVGTGALTDIGFVDGDLPFFFIGAEVRG